MKKRIIITNAIIIFISLVALLVSCCIFLVFENENAKKKEVNEYLYIACEIFDGNNASYVEKILTNSNKDIRLTIVDSTGNVILDSLADETENHLDRPEIKDLGNVYYRYSITLNQKMMYVARLDAGFYVRIALPSYAITSTVNSFIGVGVLSFFIIIAISMLVLYKLSNQMTLPIYEATKELGKIVGKDDNYNCDIENISKQIDEVKVLISNHIDSIEEQKERLNFVINNIHQGFIVINDIGNIVLINKTALDIFGIDKHQVIDKNYVYTFRNVELENTISNLMNAKKNDTLSQEFLINKRIYDTTIDIGYSNNKTQISLFIVDITEKKHLEQMKKEFFANASHELKSPLTTIIGYQDMIDQKIITSEDDINKALKQIRKEADRMNQIISEMLELSMLERKEEKEKTSFSLYEVIEDSVLSFEHEMKLKNIKIDYEIDDFNISMNSDDAVHLFRNLIDNAVKYNKENGSILIKINKEDKTFKISDTGIGIPSEDLSRIFERFYRVNKAHSREMGGTGLGLAIVKHICTNYNLKIKVESKLNEGTTFIVYFE